MKTLKYTLLFICLYGNSQSSFRVFNTLQDVINANDLQTGEAFYVRGVNSEYYVIGDVNKYMIQDKDLSLNRGISLHSDANWTGFVIGDKLRIKFRIQNPTPIGNNFLIQNSLAFGFGLERSNLRHRNVGDFDLKMYNSEGVDTGRIDKIVLGEWFIAEGTFLKDFLTTTKLQAPNSTSWGRRDGSSIDIEWIEIETSSGIDRFEVNSWDGTAIYNQDVSKRFYLSIESTNEGLTLQNPVVNNVESQDITELIIGNKLVKLIVKGNRISPQMLGYDDSLNLSRPDGNYVSDLINSIELSDYKLYLPDGIYSLDKPVDLYSPQSHYLSGGRVDFNTEEFNLSKKSRVEFYSHKKIDFFRIFTSGINIYGGYYNTSLIPFDTVKKAVFRMCFRDDNIISGNIIHPYFYGNIDVVNQEGGGYAGVLLDTSTLNPFGGGKPNAGEFHWVNFDLIGEYMDVLYLASSDPSINPNGTKSSSMNTVKFHAWKSKQGAVLDGLSGHTDIKGKCQGESLLSLNEFNDFKKNTFVYLGSDRCTVELQLVDMGDGTPTGNGKYRQTYGVTNKGKNNLLRGNWTATQKFINEITPFDYNDFPIINPNNFRLLKGTRKNGGFIAATDNIMMFADKKGVTATYTSYANVGGNFDFENVLDEASTNVNATLNSNVDITYPERIFNPNDFQYTSLQYSTGFSDTNNDFVEIVIDDLENANLASFRPSFIGFLTSDFASTFCKRIQIILKRATDTQKMFDTANGIVDIFEIKSSASINKIIIRLIGVDDNLGEIRLDGFYAKELTHNTVDSPSINIGGGQTIYGSLQMDEIKLIGDDSNVHTIKPKADTSPTTVTELLVLLKSTGIIYN